MQLDREAMDRLGIDADSRIGVHVSQCGFEPYERDDGLHPHERPSTRDLSYNKYMAERGYSGENPWHDWANAAEDDNGNILSGWLLGPSRIILRGWKQRYGPLHGTCPSTHTPPMCQLHPPH